MITVLRLRLRFAVHVWTAGRASSGKWLTARFFATKNCTVSRLKAPNSFLISVCLCVYWIFELELMNYSCFLGDKSDAFRLDEKQHGGTKQQMHALLKFEIPATWNFKRVMANCSLRFLMKNLILKVSIKHRVYGKRQTWDSSWEIFQNEKWADKNSLKQFLCIELEWINRFSCSYNEQ